MHLPRCPAMWINDGPPRGYPKPPAKPDAKEPTAFDRWAERVRRIEAEQLERAKAAAEFERTLEEELRAEATSTAAASSPAHKGSRVARKLKEKYPEGRPSLPVLQLADALGEGVSATERALSELGWTKPRAKTRT